MRIFTNKEIVTIVERNGFVYERMSGSHTIYVKGSYKLVLVLGHEMNSMTFLSECKRCQIDIRVLDKKYYKQFQRGRK